MAKVLLINPSSTVNVYNKSRIKIAIAPSLTFAALGASLLKDNHDVRILDLIFSDNLEGNVRKELESFNPEFVGITIPTTAVFEMRKIAKIVREFNKKVTLIGGGVHPTARPKETLLKSELDILVMGEGDFTISEIINGEDLDSIKGIAYKKNNGVVINERKELISDLDSLPYPAWSLYDLSKYVSPKSLSDSPVGYIETSRGCPFRCIYCNKSIFGYRFRTKSVKRVVDELEYMKKTGFKEIFISDDGFTENIERSKEICDLIISRKLNIKWHLGSGIRVDRIDREFLLKAKEAGCHRIHFGIETASPKILKEINKMANLDQVREAFRLCNEVGMDTTAYFLYGFPSETEETMKAAIKLAKELRPTFARVAIVMPYPGTELWERWNKEGVIKSHNWADYTFHNFFNKVYEHPTLDLKTIQKYYKKFHREFYFRPSYLLNRVVIGIKKGTLFDDIKYFFT